MQKCCSRGLYHRITYKTVQQTVSARVFSGESVVPEQTHEVETLQRGPGSEGQGEGAAGHQRVWVRQQGAQRAGGVRVRERRQERVWVRRGSGGKLWRTIGRFWAQQNQRDHERERAGEQRAGSGHSHGHSGLTDTNMKI